MSWRCTHLHISSGTYVRVTKIDGDVVTYDSIKGEERTRDLPRFTAHFRNLDTLGIVARRAEALAEMEGLPSAADLAARTQKRARKSAARKKRKAAKPPAPRAPKKLPPQGIFS